MADVTYDPEGDVLYVRLSDQPVESTITLGDLRMIDYSADGAVVGVEFVGARGGVDLADVPFKERIAALIRDSGHPIPVFA